MMLHQRSGCACAGVAVAVWMRARRIVCLGCAVFVLVALWGAGLLPSVALAQTQDPNLVRKMERLQKELNDLQRYVYRGGGAATGAGPSSGEVVGTDVAARMQLQINQMQEQLRTMNGRVEEIEHRISVLEQRLGRMAEDLEIRLQHIEDAVAGGAAVAPSPGEQGPDSAAAADRPATASPDTPATPVLPEGATPREQYDFAYELLKKRDYSGASVALEAFLEKNPDDQMAANAIYWLGETHYARQEYKAAAKVFLEGYQKYPKHAKAPDNLLKLGMSLAAYGDTDNACKTFKKLLSTFPDAPARITKAAKNEQQKLSCT